MAVVGNNIRIGASAAGVYEIEKSLRFQRSSNGKLTRTPSAGNRRTWTWSGWVKITGNTNEQFLFGVATSSSNSDSNYGIINFRDDDLRMSRWSGHLRQTDAKFRDPHGWYHIVVVFDTNNGAADDRCRLYSNGVRITSFSTNTTISSGFEGAINTNDVHTIGGSNHSSHSYDGYMAEIHFLDGVVAEPSSFGETNAATGQWIPKAFDHSSLNKENNNNNWSGNSTNLSNAANAFNGSLTGTECYTSGGSAGNEGYFTLPTNITTSSLDVYIGTGVAGAEWWAEDTGGTKYTYSGGSNGWQAIPLGGTRTISKLGTKRNGSGSGSGHLGWRVDGEVLINNYTTNANGFYLNFSDNSGTTATTLGKDSSGNGNNYTPANFGIAAGEDNDSLLDSPTNNYCTMTPLKMYSNYAVAPSNGNLNCNNANANTQFFSSMALPPSGKWYAEVTWVYVESGSVGIIGGEQFGQWNGWRILQHGVIRYNNSNTQTSLASQSNGDTIGIAVNRDANTIQFYKNGSTIGNAETISATGYFYFSQWRNSSSGGSPSADWNFGQRPYGNQPSGFNEVCTANLPEPTIAKSNDYFNTKLYTGSGSTNHSITGVGFQPDVTWIKCRSQAYSNYLWDSVRGAGKQLKPDVVTAESTNNNNLYSFDADGFSLAQSGNDDVTNDSGESFASWNWKETPAAGFDIVGYEGNATARTIEHNLNAVPDVMIIKGRENGDVWIVYHKGMASGAASAFTMLDRDNGQESAGAGYFNSTVPTSEVFSVGTDGSVNSNNNDMIAYLYSSIEGFSKFGFYNGNGNGDGQFIYTGFRPAWVMIHRTDSTHGWFIFDSKRTTYNPLRYYLRADISDQGLSSDGAVPIDLISNGFKLRDNGNATNNGSGTYIYMAFAESPFKYSNAR